MVTLPETVENDIVNALSSLKYGDPASDSEAVTFFDAYVDNAKNFLLGIHRLIPPFSSDNHRRYIMAQAVSLLLDEWKRVEPIYRNLLNKDKLKPETVTQIINQIDQIVRAAKRVLIIDVDLDVSVTPDFNTGFETIRVPYYPQKILLSIPIYTMAFTDVQKVLWHELATLVVNPTGVAPIPNEFSEQNYRPEKLFDLLNTPGTQNINWDDDTIHADYHLPDTVTTSKTDHGGWQYFWTYWADQLFLKEQKETIGIDHLAKPTRAKLREADQYPVDWRIAHLEELIEDACSTFVFGTSIYKTYQKVFGHYYKYRFRKLDIRHPSPEFRLEVTYQLLKLMKESNTAAGSTIYNVDDSLIGVTSTEDKLSDRHDQIPGAKQIARWIFDNQDKLIKTAQIQAIQSDITSAGTELSGTFIDQLTRLCRIEGSYDYGGFSAQSADDDTDQESFAELGMRMLAHVDPIGKHSQSPLIDSTLPPLEGTGGPQ